MIVRRENGGVGHNLKRRMLRDCAGSFLSRKVGACAAMGRVQGGARAAFAKVCKMSVAGGCLQTHMTECSHGRRRRQL